MSRLRSPQHTFRVAVRCDSWRLLDAALNQGVDPDTLLVRRGHNGRRTRETAMERWVTDPERQDDQHKAPLVARLLQSGANPNGLKAHGRSVLWLSALYHQWSSMLHLIEHGADMLHHVDAHQHPWAMAVSHAQTKVVDAMVQRGWDVNRALKGRTGLHRICSPAASDDDDPNYPPRDQRRATLEVLLNAGADPNAPVRTWTSPLVLMLGEDEHAFDRPMFERLVAVGAKIDVVMDHPHKFREPYQSMSRRGASLNQPDPGREWWDETRWTMLHLAAMTDEGALCVRLVELGLDPHAQTDRGRTAVDVARYHGAASAMAALEGHVLRATLSRDAPALALEHRRRRL